MDGIIIINKEKDWTSNDIVQKLKGIFKKKVGHTGTLDPQATGVLPILVGKGTSLSKYLINHDKEYIATIKLGQKTSTGDGEGEVIEEKPINEKYLEEDYIKKILEEFKGKQSQIPPMYSAIKVNGKKLYEYARKGKQIEVKPREIEIYNIELIEVSKDTKEIVYKVWCSKGTYIRSLCEDIAKKLETVGFMKDLNRTRVGEFEINQAIKILDVENIKDLSNLKFISIEEFFKNKKSINLNEEKMIKFLNGVKVFVGLEDGIYKVYNNKEFVGIGVVKDKKIKRDIVVIE
jgi:tRNA pseudouridine55 synthase